MAVDVKTAFEDLVRRIIGDPAAARAYASDQQGTLAEVGVTGGELSPTQMRAIVEDVCSEMDLSPQVSASLQAYTGNTAVAGVSATAPAPPPAAAPPAQPPLQTVQQHLNYVTYATYEDNDTVTQLFDNSTNIDNTSNTNIDVEGNVLGDIDVDNTNVNATGDGSVAAGRDVENAQTGDGGVLVDGDNSGNIQTGDGIQVDGDVDDSALVAGDVSNSNVVGDMDDSSIVSGNTVGGDVVSIGDVDDSALGFGEGNVGNVSDIDTNGGTANVGQNQGDGINQVDTNDTAAAQGGGDALGDVDDSAVGDGATNVSDLDDGSAAAVGGGAATGSDINDAFNENTDSAFEQGPGDQTVETPPVEAPPEPPADPIEDLEV